MGPACVGFQDKNRKKTRISMGSEKYTFLYNNKTNDKSITKIRLLISNN